MEMVEHVDTLEVNGVTIHKPFVEKPISAENHHIHVYYPSSVGGGSQRLFRKVGAYTYAHICPSLQVKNRSSEYSKESAVRKDGSYIYEQFVASEGIDIKVYAVGPFYAHAEARKSPALDGKVDRNSHGKEIRYPVILTAKEKEIAHSIVTMFGVCGVNEGIA
jgi:inositol hexakisphosphate/diphosphoinositol-pentakisphosphate kinase